MDEFKDIKDYVLSEEEIKQLPEPIKKQRDAHIEYIHKMETEHPLKDGGESCRELSSIIMIRAVLDEVTRNVLDNSNN